MAIFGDLAAWHRFEAWERAEARRLLDSFSNTTAVSAPLTEADLRAAADAMFARARRLPPNMN